MNNQNGSNYKVTCKECECNTCLHNKCHYPSSASEIQECLVCRSCYCYSGYRELHECVDLIAATENDVKIKKHRGWFNHG